MKLSFNKEIAIAAKVISPEAPTFVIAEAGVNHNGDINLAHRLIDEAKKAGADAVKFQAFRTEELILDSVDKAPYQKRTTGADDTQFSMLKKLELTKEQYRQLKDYCEKVGILFLITPFDEVSLNDLDDLHVSAYKISSTDLTNLPFLKRVALKKKPIILSSGMSYMSEVEAALREIHPHNQSVVLLQCTANYPVQDQEVNLRVLETYQKRFDVLVGYSDHTVGIGASPYAVAAGARVIEKHFTLDKKMQGPDHEASLDLSELRTFIQEIRRVELFMGSGEKQPQESEFHTRKSLQKSLVASRSIKKGEVFSEANIIAKRCGGVGVSPIKIHELYGKSAPRDFSKNEVLTL